MGTREGGVLPIFGIGMIVFLGVVIGDLVFFRELFKQNPLKTQNWYLLGYKNIF